jgi:hypothetical protein
MLDNSTVSGNSLDMVGVGLDKEILDTEGLGKEILSIECGSGISAAFNPLSTPYSLGGGKGMVPIMKLLLHVSNLAFLAGRRLTYGIIGATRRRIGLDFATILSKGEMWF